MLEEGSYKVIEGFGVKKESTSLQQIFRIYFILQVTRLFFLVVVFQVGDNSFDLPEANVLIQVRFVSVLTNTTMTSAK